MTVPTSGPASTTAILTYFVPPAPGVRAFQNINADPTTGQRIRNFHTETRPAVIENLRGQEENVGLDITGFTLLNEPSKFWGESSTSTDGSASVEGKEGPSDDAIKSAYYEESEQVIKKATGATRVVFFDHTIRRRRPGVIDTPDTRQPVSQTHVDQTPTSSLARVHRHLPASIAPELVKRRYQIINLWRPINNPAIDWPLALCDYRTVNADKDVFPVALVYPDREGETYGVQYGENQKWKYFYGVTPDECILIKCFDSVRDGSVAQFTPHTGFQDPTTPEGTPARESIELRALVFYED